MSVFALQNDEALWDRRGCQETRGFGLSGGNAVSIRQRLALLLVLFAGPGCTHVAYWVQPIRIDGDGYVSGNYLGSGYRRNLTLQKPGQKMRLWLQSGSPLCVAESAKPVCVLEGRFLRLDFSFNGEVTGLVVTPTSLYVEDSLGGPRKPIRKTLAVPAAKVRLAIGDIKAFGQDEYYPYIVPG